MKRRLPEPIFPLQMQALQNLSTPLRFMRTLPAPLIPQPRFAPINGFTRKGNKVSVVLLEQLDNIGHLGQEVLVTPGYARNFLIPKHKAVYATLPNKQKFQVVLSAEDSKTNEVERQINMLKQRISNVSLSFFRGTSDGIHLYGSVSAAEIAESLASTSLKNLNIREKQVRILGNDRVIKVVGEHLIEIEARPNVWCSLKVSVESS
jgi:large subunit ribosomal protein L9